MSALFNLIYREYCKAQLAEMQKQRVKRIGLERAVMKKARPRPYLLASILIALGVWATIGPPPTHSKSMAKLQFAGPPSD